MKGIIFILLVLCGTQSLHAQSWIKLAQKDGGAVRSLSSNKFGDLYCAALNQVYRSVDQGVYWQKLKTPVDTVFSVQLYPSSDSNSITALIALASGTLMRSTDDGATWRELSALVDSIRAGTLSNVFSSRFGSLVFSFKRGASFDVMQSRDNGNTLELLAKLPSSPSEVYQAQDSTFYFYTGSTYRLNKDGSVSDVGALRITGSSQDFFNAPVNLWAIQNGVPMRSTNKGDQWRNMKYNFSEPSPGVITTLLTGRDSEAYLFWRSTTDSMRIYRLNNGSTTWLKIRDQKFSFGEIIVNANGTMVASALTGIYITEEGPQRWTNSSQGISTYPLRCAAFSQNAIGVIGYNGIISQSNTGGLSWSTSNTPAGSDATSAFNDMLTTSTGHIVIASPSGIWLSSDLGLNYLAAQSMGQPFTKAAYSLAEVSRGVVYATSASGLLRSPDGGLNWMVLDSMESAREITSIGDGTYYCTRPTGLYLGSDSVAGLQLVDAGFRSGKMSVTRKGDVCVAVIDSIGIEKTVTLYRKKRGGVLEKILIPTTGKSLPTVWVVAARNGDAFVNTELGLYYIASESSLPVEVQVESEVFTFLRTLDVSHALGATLYGGVYIYDFQDAVPDHSSESDRELLVYPQPASGLCTVRLSRTMSRVQLFDVDGGCIESKSVADDAGFVTLDVGTLSSGIYIVRAHGTDGQVSSKRVIVHH